MKNRCKKYGYRMITSHNNKIIAIQLETNDVALILFDYNIEIIKITYLSNVNEFVCSIDTRRQYCIFYDACKIEIYDIVNEYFMSEFYFKICNNTKIGAHANKIIYTTHNTFDSRKLVKNKIIDFNGKLLLNVMSNKLYCTENSIIYSNNDGIYHYDELSKNVNLMFGTVDQFLAYY